MKRGWVAPLIVITGLALLAWWIARNTYWDEIRVPVGLRGDAATNPFYSQQHLAEALGARTERRHVLGSLPAAHGVIVLSAWHWSVIDSRRHQLEDWVAAGGRLVVDGSLIGGEKELQQWSGLSRQRALENSDEEAAQQEPAPSGSDGEGPQKDPQEQAPDNQPPLLFRGDNGVCTDLTSEPAISGRESFEVCQIAPDSWLISERRTAWTLRDNGELQGARVNIGRGSITLLNATPFDNRALLENDHALLFVAATQLQRGDEVLFLSEERRASLLSLMWTYGAPALALALLLLGLALWRGAVRFGPLAALTDTARRSIAEQIRGTGQFTLRFGGGRALHAAMVRALHETAAKRIPGYASLPREQQVSAIARVAEVDADNLAHIINHAGARRAGDLRNAVMVLEYTRRRLLDASTAKGVANAN